LSKYFLTGQLLEASVGSICMFALPPDFQFARSRNESCFHSLEVKELVKHTQVHNGDFVAAAVDIFRSGIAKLNHRIHQGVVLISVAPPTVVSLRNPAAIAQIRGLNPYTISWNNCLDYFTIDDFHQLARACSAPEDTVHYGYSMNWVQNVKGACSLAFDTGPHMEKLLHEARKSHSMILKLAGLEGVFMSPPLDNPINLLDVSARAASYRHWVDKFFASVKNIGNVVPNFIQNPFARYDLFF
jgi:hypothetical protein